jgi:hypothetical protein
MSKRNDPKEEWLTSLKIMMGANFVREAYGILPEMTLDDGSAIMPLLFITLCSFLWTYYWIYSRQSTIWLKFLCFSLPIQCLLLIPNHLVGSIHIDAAILMDLIAAVTLKCYFWVNCLHLYRSSKPKYSNEWLALSRISR